jgi:hypothetical protein
VPNTKRPGAARFLGLLLIVVATAAAGFGVAFYIKRTRERVEGNVRGERMSVGTFAFAVTDCASGLALAPSFLGADLRGEGFNLRAVGSGDGAQLWLNTPATQLRRIGINKQHCTRWDVAARLARVTVSRVETVDGHVHATCTVEGGRLIADVEFARCAQ